MSIARSQMNRQLYADGTMDISPEGRRPEPLVGIKQLQQFTTDLETVVGDAVKMVAEATGMGMETAVRAVAKVIAKLNKINPEAIRTGGSRLLVMETMKELSSGKPNVDEEAMSLLKGLRPQASNEEFMTKVNERENLLAPGEDAGEGYTGAPDMYPDYEEDAQEMANGGIMSLNRQGYFLGGIGKSISKAVKGVTKAVKGIVSSDIGKLALTAAAVYYGGPMLSTAMRGPSTWAGIGELAKSKLLGVPNFIGEYEGGPFSSITNLLTGRESPTAVLKGYGKGQGILSSSVLPFIGGSILGSAVSGGGEEEDTQLVDQSGQVSDWTQRLRERLQGPWDYTSNTYKNYNPIAMAANGGRIGYARGSVEEGIMAAPQIAQQMGMPVGNPRQNQQGVSELDYRDEGGFVPPIGVKEREDDIPAMLSNNEFVFTADAVRNAGGGDPNAGAQKMYALMKQLEGGGIA